MTIDLRPALCGMLYNGGAWVRVFGWGVAVSDKVKHPPLFSERNGYRRVFRLGRWGVEFLKG